VEQIVATADALNAELIVMPTAGRAGVFEALRGSTTERVLRHASCPLLAVPAAELHEDRPPTDGAGTKLMASP